MKINLFVLTLVTLLTMDHRCSEASEGRSRRKRFLLEPDGTQMGWFATISAPLEFMKQVSVAYFFEGNYYTINNVTWLQPLIEGPTITSARHERSIDSETLFNSLSRRFAYIVLENHFEKLGLPGRACLLRALCEHSEAPLIHNGVLGDILYILFTPSSSRDEGLPEELYRAEEAGARGDCEKYTKGCPESFMQSFSATPNRL